MEKHPKALSRTLVFTKVKKRNQKNKSRYTQLRPWKRNGKEDNGAGQQKRLLESYRDGAIENFFFSIFSNFSFSRFACSKSVKWPIRTRYSLLLVLTSGEAISVA